MRNSLIVLTLIFSQILFANAQSEENEVEIVIASLFEGMKTKNQDLLEKAFLKDAIMQTTIDGSDGATISSNSVQDFLNRIATTPDNTILDEQILDYQIKIDGNMASAWTPYEFYVNEGFSHCGVNSFQLIKTSEGWKITYIIDTRHKVGCK
ncbi:nuclear transport factor 2 family protein [Belliella sp. DSM 107340]|uniref:Nuclear transport factor 2 family protein n=1 Tax=Belliella calami TaxID=2923436 RepID=A0ABS9UPR0_9BACT|nr:nuclear transport factor 2 family protein [Belliella calami]MCH7398596.1 nuclear transport factor 2 family protein [Belliella calami]